MQDQKTINKKTIFFISVCIGIVLRYIAMTLGHNYDFESYCIVGEIAGNFRNVYAETPRYNYAPVFFCIQGLLYRISGISPENRILVYRVLIVAVLTAADLGICAFIAKRYSPAKALLFFLNPVSIFITGYHNQFDNMAVFFALLSCIFYNEEEKIGKKDICFILMFSLSLITKHILFMLPMFILFIKKLPLKKKILYAFVPPAVFLLSFVPFALSGKEAFEGILHHVFLYRSFNNAPLLSVFYNLVSFPSSPRIIVYGILMMITAWIVRKRSYEHIIMIYLISMVTFSSAVANQYLVIPMAALCILDTGIWDKVYMIAVSLFLIVGEDGLGVAQQIQTIMPGSLPDIICSFYADNGYVFAAWILFLTLLASGLLVSKTKTA